MDKILVVVDYQNDFVDGALGTKEAVAIVPNVAKKIREFDGDEIFVTYDTHYDNYLSTLEGQKLPVPHCIDGSFGHELNAEVKAALAGKQYKDVIKAGFGSFSISRGLKDRYPGEEYKYISENIYMLCAILTRVTGMSVRDYLQPRLFEPLGIDYPFWETDANGIEAGGWGLYVKTEDVAKLMLCYQHDGKFRNKQVIPAEFAKAAHEAQTDNSANCYADSNNGYGYCLWICGLPNTYRCDGMFSQFGIVFEDYDALFVMTSAIPPEQEARDFLWRFIPAMFLDETKDNGDTSVPGLKERLKNAVLETPCEKSAKSPLQAKIDGKTIRFNKKIFLNLIGFPMSMLPLAVTYMTTDKAGNIDNVKFTFGDGTLDMYWTEGDESNTVTAGLDGRFVYGEMRLGGIDYKVCCTAKWKADDTLFVQVRPIETIGKRMLDFTFKNNGRVNMKPSSSPSILEIGRSLVLGLGDLTSSQLIIGAAGKAIKLLPPILEPSHRGKIK